MSRINSFAAIVLGGALAAMPAFSQETGRSEASVQAFGSFVKTTNQDGIQQGATNSGGVLASYRYFFLNNPRGEGDYRFTPTTPNFGWPSWPPRRHERN